VSTRTALVTHQLRQLTHNGRSQFVAPLTLARSRLLRFANKKAFVGLFGVVGLIFSSTHAFYNGTITTIEKRFKIPSRNIGIIATGNDITSLMLSTFIAYYVGKGKDRQQAGSL
jgi:hypothetical protein